MFLCYIFPIMLKWLAIVTVFGALLFGGPCVAQEHLSQPQATEHSPNGQQKPVTPSSPVVNHLLAAPCTQTKPCYIQENPPEKPLPRPIRPEWVIVYITAIYVVISALMFLAIKRQAGQMEAQTVLIGKQTDILDKSVAAAQRSADAAFAQMRLMKDKERARLSVSISADEFEVGVDDFDAIIVKVANDGLTSALNVIASGGAFGEPGENLPFMGQLQTLKLPGVLRSDQKPAAVEIVFVSRHDLREFWASCPTISTSPA